VLKVLKAFEVLRVIEVFSWGFGFQSTSSGNPTTENPGNLENRETVTTPAGHAS